MTSQPLNENLIKQVLSMDRPIINMALIAKAGLLDKVAPLHTRGGIEMRLDMLIALDEASMLLDCLNLLTTEEANRIMWAVHDMSEEVFDAADKLGIETDLRPPSPETIGVKRPEGPLTFPDSKEVD